MITARLVGDDAVLAWLRATPDLAAAGLARAITQLGIEVQSKINSSTSLQIDQSDNGIAATVSNDSGYAHAHESGFTGAVDVRANLHRKKKAFGRPTSGKVINVRSQGRRIDVPEHSFLRSALEDMDPAIRDEVETALREALTR